MTEGTFVGTDEIAVVVVCHDKYLPYLPEQIAHVENQTIKPAQRIIAYDGVDYMRVRMELLASYPEWMVVADFHGNPNPLRNRALAICQADWIVFSDADDYMHAEYIEKALESIHSGGENIGIYYADLNFTNGKKITTPDKFDYWQLRLSNFVSAASVWRVEAAREAGGWQRTDCYDDWTLALAVTARGWECAKLPRPILCRWHGGNRREDSRGREWFHKWNRSYAVATLLAGRFECLPAWADYLMDEELPPNTTLYILDNSRDVKFTEAARREVETIGAAKNIPVVYQIDNAKCDPDSHPLARHRHVPGLYNRILPQISQDMVLTLEDDVLPKKQAFWRVVNAFHAGGKCGAVSGVYPSRSGGDRIVGAFGADKPDGDYPWDYDPAADYWRNMLTTEDARGEEIINVDFIGGGFTLWNNALIKRFLPFRFLDWHGKASGWDSQISRNIRRAGYQLWIDPKIKCEHKYR